MQKYPLRLSALPEVGVEAWDCGEWHPNAILAILTILAILARFCRNCTGFPGMARCSSGLHANATDLGCRIVLSALPYHTIWQDTFALLLMALLSGCRSSDLLVLMEYMITMPSIESVLSSGDY